ncbi:hypothetical protein CFC21_095240 [Triticum aestivum]|uniref:Pectinesterase inhibitor domain-containing protein n=2 Tax=Triticum aestivum TaxID=4565 RepID=A0A9R1LPZ4_WHEAT|nr:hypothetical protein CFC21_095240 [Triticum aestivum]
MAISTVVVMLLSSAMAAHASGGGKKDNTSLVMKACKNISGQPFKVGFLPEFCASTLLSDNRSAEAKDCRGLALIIVDILKVHAAAMVGKVDNMLREGGRIATKDKIAARALRLCRADYGGMVNTLQICHNIIQDFGRKGKHGPTPSELPECVEKMTNSIKDCTHEVCSTSVAGTMANEILEKLAIVSKALINLFLADKKDGN